MHILKGSVRMCSRFVVLAPILFFSGVDINAATPPSPVPSENSLWAVKTIKKTLLDSADGELALAVFSELREFLSQAQIEEVLVFAMGFQVQIFYLKLLSQSLVSDWKVLSVLDRTVLMLAIEYDSRVLFETFLSLEVDFNASRAAVERIVTTPNKQGLTSLMVAVQQAERRFYVESLLGMPQEVSTRTGSKSFQYTGNLNINAHDGHGRTALMYAAQRGHSDYVQLLLKKGADHKLQDCEGKTAQQYAREHQHEGVFRMLQEHADRQARSLHQPTSGTALCESDGGQTVGQEHSSGLLGHRAHLQGTAFVDEDASSESDDTPELSDDDIEHGRLQEGDTPDVATHVSQVRESPAPQKGDKCLHASTPREPWKLYLSVALVCGGCLWYTYMATRSDADMFSDMQDVAV